MFWKLLRGHGIAERPAASILQRSQTGSCHCHRRADVRREVGSLSLHDALGWVQPLHVGDLGILGKKCGNTENASTLLVGLPSPLPVVNPMRQFAKNQGI